MQRVVFKDLGLLGYKQAWELQEKCFSEVLDIKLKNRELSAGEQLLPLHYLLFCEHPHVYTLGKSGSEQHLLASPEELLKTQATFYKINRGGDITYHGPGQLVGYPIFDLDYFFTDIHRYMRTLEEAVILTLAAYGIHGGRIEKLTGVWLDPDVPGKARKICALGVHCSRWVTMHGFALNVNTDLSYFGNIVPCGISDKAVTSMEKELGRKVDMEEIKEMLKMHLAALFHLTFALPAGSL